MRIPPLATPLLLAALAHPAWAQSAAPAPTSAPAAPASPSLSQASFDPAPYLAKTRWADGCYGVSMGEPAGMRRTAETAHWLFQEGPIQYGISASFILPPPRTNDERATPLALKDTLTAVLANLTNGQGAAIPLPQFTRDFLADKHPCTVAYALAQPQIHRRAGAPAQDAFLIGVGAIQINPRCHLALTLICRIPAGAADDLPYLVDAQRKLEAALGSVHTTPEEILATVRNAQLERGEQLLQSLTPDRTQAALADFGSPQLLRVVQHGADVGWAQWEMRHQDAHWYQTHRVQTADVDGLGQSGIKVAVKSHTQSADASADVTQTSFHPDRSVYDAWRRTTTWRENIAKTKSSVPPVPQTTSETGYLTRLPGRPEVAQLNVEWTGSTPAELSHFFSTNPDWRKPAYLGKFWGGSVANGDAPIDGRAISAGPDNGKNLNGDLTQKKWPIPLDPRRPYLSQAQAALMPWLLPADTAQSYAFCFYSQEAKHPGICLFKVAPHADGTRTVVFRPALDQPEQAFELDAKGKLLHITPAPDIRLIPATTEEMARIWKLGTEK